MEAHIAVLSAALPTHQLQEPAVAFAHAYFLVSVDRRPKQVSNAIVWRFATLVITTHGHNGVLVYNSRRERAKMLFPPVGMDHEQST